MANITRTSDREREMLRRSALGADQGPSAETQAGAFPRGTMMGELGDPQDPTNVSFPFLRRMRRDHMVAMGLHFIDTPIVKAPFYYEDDGRGQIAAFADNLIRPIYGNLLLLLLRSVSFGYSPGAKNFMTINPGWTYVSGQENKRVWDQGGVDALVYKDVTPLRPENATPVWRDGKFSGIGYDSRYGGIGYFIIGGRKKEDVDLLHSVWSVHDKVKEDGCQPAGEMVLTTEGYVPIEELDPERHKLVSYNPSASKIHRGVGSSPKHRGYSFEVFTRSHRGKMLAIFAGDDGKAMRCTPNHKLTVRWAEHARDQWAVYLMRRGDDWRIGTTKVINQKSKQTNSGVGARMQRERADEGWILETFDSRQDALFHEALWSQTYSVPDRCFTSTNTASGMDQEALDRYWACVISKPGALLLLAEKNRELGYPLYEREDGIYGARQAGRVQWTTHAANLIPGSMELPIDPGEGMRPVWREFRLDHSDFDDVVYSLQVDPYKHYISGGIITRNSPFGFPRIAHCAPIFHMYRYIWTLLGRAFENNADPGPVVRYPRDALPELDGNGNRINPVTTALTIGRRKRSGSTIALPSDPYTDYQDKPTGKYKWDIEYPKSQTDFDQIMNFLGFLEAAKLRALWIQEQGLIEGSGGQSNRNVASEFGQQRDDSQALLMMQLDEDIDQQFVRPAIAMNFPWYEGKLVKKTLGPGHEDEEIVRQILQLAGQEDFREFGVDTQRILDSHGIPLLDIEEIKRRKAEDAKAASTTPTPAVTPTQGRRALVTQTGFDRETRQPIMSYHEIGSEIHLGVSGDDDFVSSLPRTDTFSDRRTVASARDLRTASSAFLTWAYGDFARYLGKQRNLNLAELLDKVEREYLADHPGEELAAADKVSKAVDRIIAGWRPKVDRISEFSKKARDILGRVFDNVARLQLARVGSEVRTSSTDKAAAAWLDERGAELVTGVLETTRKQLATVLADGVRAGKATSEIASDIREHFDEFPASRAAAIARTEVGEAYNFATVTAGIDAGLAKCQLVDGTDASCKKRNGKIVGLAAALKERLNHTNCTLFIKLLPRASANLEIRRERLVGLQARYDEATQTILLSPDISPEDETKYLLALGEDLSQPLAIQEPVA